MLKDSLCQLYRKVILLQVFLALVAAATALVVVGSYEAHSALAGGFAAIAGSLVYSLLAQPAGLVAVPAKLILRRHVAAEAAKVSVVSALVFGLLLADCFAPGWLVAAMSLCLLANWVAILIIR